ncbi:MAG: DNA-directed RNA polymerase subunit beta [Bacilli bacterium]
MSYKLENFGRRKRRNFAKAEYSLAMPNLLDVQKKSYQWFQEEGIKEVLKNLSPVDSFNGVFSLEFGDYSWDEPRYTVKECRDKDGTYSAPLKVQVRLFNHETGEVKGQEIFLGDMPIMTDNGSFIINGAERVIVSQLVRSPSIYFLQEIDKNGRITYNSQVIPNHGTWLEYEIDARDVVYVRIDRTRKVALTTLLRALGLSSDEDILELFGEEEYIVNTLAKDSTRNTSEALIEIYEKLKPGEPPTIESAKNQIITRFFDDLRYDLAKVGRYKFNKKLNIAGRLLNQVLAEDIVVKNKVVLEKGTKLIKENLDILDKYLKDGYGLQEVKINEELNTFNKVQIIKIQSPNDRRKTLKVIGNDQSISARTLTISDVFASASYYFNLLHDVGTFDEIDHLGNRRIKQVGELLQNQFKIGLSRMERVIRERMTTQEIETVTPKSLINIRPVTAAMKEFFGSSQLSQFLDQTNPIAELTSKRRLSALGPGGLSRDRAGMEVRDVHYSHYGRICPIESPEGPNIGLINYLALYAVINEYGFIMTPYRKVVKGKITDEIVYLTADEENGYYISQSTVKVNDKREIIVDHVDARYNGNNVFVTKDQIDYVDVAPQQIISVTSDCIPFLEHDDAVRALMGANMQRQAVPLLTTEAPLVGTGIEHIVAHNSGISIVSKASGEVEYVDARKIVINTKSGKDTYHLTNFEPSNQGTCYTHRPLVKKGEKVKRNEIIADGASTDKGELALGKNVVVAFMTYDGYNYEDAVILSERLVKDDVYTSIHIENYEIQARETKLGPEEITRDIPNVSEDARKNLDANGIVRIGTEVKEGDILVGKVTPKGMTELSSEEKLLHAIFGEKTREVRDTSLRVPHGRDGIIHDVKVFSRENKDELSAGINIEVKVYIAQKRKISVGDKMAGRHGNKGVISLILPEEDMPYLPDGTPVDVMLNPLGVPSRMNIGQVLEMHLGLAAKTLNIHVSTPVFDGASYPEIEEMMKEANIAEDGKTWLYDGRTGDKFDQRICVGVMYMIKLNHMIDDKLHARATGPYSLVTQQPLGGKAQFGGQRFGEMEVWALYAYGAAHTLQEMMTVKSDDVIGRVKVYEALVKGNPIQEAGVPESFRVLIKEFQALGLDISIINDDDESIELKTIEETEDKTITTLNIEEIGEKDDSEVLEGTDGGEAK